MYTDDMNGVTVEDFNKNVNRALVCLSSRVQIPGLML